MDDDLSVAVLGVRNMGYEIVAAVTTEHGDLYVTGAQNLNGDVLAVTWFADYHNDQWCFSAGRYFTSSTNPHNVNYAIANMYKRAGYADC